MADGSEQTVEVKRGKCIICREEILASAGVPLVGKVELNACEKHRAWVELGLNVAGTALRAGARVAVDAKAPGLLEKIDRIWRVVKE